MSEDNSRTLAIVNTLRIMLGDLAGQISIERRTHILRSLNLAVETSKDDPLVSLDDIAEQRQRTEALDKQFRRYQPPSTKAQGKGLSNKSPVNTGNRQHGQQLYIFPPWNLLPHFLQKLQEEKLVATVITPY
ncbi:hypothetical protein BGZ58_004755 [Dissophora ornata]|nr:hypothetical protein BGZ58_004755 [Dissophora ornata]